ncbi:MAG: squalene/phytoene synthase family protein [Alphaproteobacteria bacterium]
MQKNATDYCLQQLKLYDYDRFLMGLFWPSQLRPLYSGLMAFNVEITRTRDAVTEPLMGQIRLQWWREAIEKLYAGQPLAHEVITALHSLPQTAVSQDLLQELIEAREADLDDTPPINMQELQNYATRTHAPLLLAMRQLLNIDPALFSDEMIKLCASAYGFTKILLSLPNMLAKEWPIIPLSLYSNQEVSNLLRPENRAEFDKIIQQLHEAATHITLQARSLTPPKGLLLQPLILAEYYLAQIKRHDYFLAHPAIWQAKLKKIWLLAGNHLK